MGRVKEARAIQPAVKPPPPSRPPRALTEREVEEVAARRRVVIEHMPEMVPVIKELQELGMIDGWRNVIKAHAFAPNEKGTPS